MKYDVYCILDFESVGYPSRASGPQTFGVV